MHIRIYCGEYEYAPSPHGSAGFDVMQSHSSYIGRENEKHTHPICQVISYNISAKNSIEKQKLWLFLPFL